MFKYANIFPNPRWDSIHVTSLKHDNLNYQTPDFKNSKILSCFEEKQEAYI